MTGGVSGTYVNTMINRCNQRPVTEAHGFRMPVDASMSANTRKAVTVDMMLTPPEVGVGFAGGDVNRTDQFEIQVECVPVIKTSKSEHKPDPHRTKVDVQNIDLFLSTYPVRRAARAARPASRSRSRPGSAPTRPARRT